MTVVATDKANFKQRVTRWAVRLDVTFDGLTIRKMCRKWASCSTAGRLTFDTACIDLRPNLQDYVVVHELLHLRVPNHGKLWKSLMRAHLGNFETMEAELRRQAGQQTRSLAATFERSHVRGASQ
jgi:predicted metal-dependent hydrolase